MIDLAKLEAAVMARLKDVNTADVYRQKAAEEFGVPYEQVTPKQRSVIKARCYVEMYSGQREVT